MKQIKRVISLMAAVVMMFSMSMDLFAAEEKNHVITLSGAKAGHEYAAYQIFKGDLNEDETILSNIDWGEGIDGPTFLAELKEISLYASCEDAEAVAEVLAGFGDDSEEIDAFAEIAAKHLTTEAGVSSYDEESETYRITGLSDGYYFVKDTKTIEENDAATKFILQVVKDVNMEVKSDVPSLEKHIISDGENVKADNGAIGDLVSYVLTSNVPDMDGYEKYYFIVHDTFSDGLTYQNDAAVTVGTKTLSESEFSVTQDGQSIKIVLNDFISYKEQAGAGIRITYSAKINENAVIGTTGNNNEAYLQYSNDPNTSSNGINEPLPEDPDVTGDTPKSYTITFVTGIQLTKVDDSTPAVPLTGAEFKISGEQINRVKIVKDGVVSWNETTEKVSATALVGDDGVLTFEGLASGEYVITELKAPDGYNLLKEEINVVINCTLPETVEDGTETAAWTYSVSGAMDVEETEAVDGLVALKIVNKAGAVLPSTGGIGTTIFYVSGLFLMAAAVFFLNRRYRFEK